jgi:hypothetical protein
MVNTVVGLAQDNLFGGTCKHLHYEAPCIQVRAKYTRLRK